MQRARHRFALRLCLGLLLLAGCDGDDAGDGAFVDASLAAGDGGTPVDGAPLEPLRCEVVAPTACTDPELGFADVQPILESRCVGCHDGRSDFWPLKEYSHVAAWFIEIRAAMLDCSMPPPDSGLTMPDEERELLLHWIRCGYPP